MLGQTNSSNQDLNLPLFSRAKTPLKPKFTCNGKLHNEVLAQNKYLYENSKIQLLECLLVFYRIMGIIAIFP